MSRTTLPDDAERVFHFWFREMEPAQWFEGGPELDATVRERFAGLLEQGRAGDLDHWAQSPRGRLALVILLDQFSRHIHRGEGSAFASDLKAQALVREAIASGEDERLNFAERHFLYMPLMHSEDPAVQDLSLNQFRKLEGFAQYVLSFAEGHRAIVHRFGRFPFRNKALGRETTAEEKAFLSSDENPFG